MKQCDFLRRVARNGRERGRQHTRRRHADARSYARRTRRIITDQTAALFNDDARRRQRAVGFERKARQMECQPQRIHDRRAISRVAASRDTGFACKADRAV